MRWKSYHIKAHEQFSCSCKCFLRTEVFKFLLWLQKEKTRGDKCNLSLWMKTAIKPAWASHAMAAEEKRWEKSVWKDTLTHIHTHIYTYTPSDWVLSNTHRNMHMVAPLCNLRTVQFKGVQVRWRSLLLFQLLALLAICSDLVRSGFYELHKGMVIRASEWRWAVWPLSVAAGVLSALMWIKLLNNFWEVEGATETLQKAEPLLYKW